MEWCNVMKKTVILLSVTVAATISLYFLPLLSADGYAASVTKSNFSKFVDAEGNISRPHEFRKNWAHLGSWLVKNDDQATGPGIHDVYTEAASVEAFRQSGEWPDGATLVKEIRSIENKAMTTGNAQWAGEPVVWFVMVRDRKNRFPNNKAWGEGWGWALFEAENPDKNVTTTWKGTGFNNCYGCHLPAEETEWVYIEGYPTIRDAANYESAKN